MQNTKQGGYFVPAYFFSVRGFLPSFLRRKEVKGQNIRPKISSNGLVKLCESNKEAKVAFTVASDLLTRNLVAVAIM